MRVLIAEDEFLVGIQLEDDLRSAGCSVAGPFSTLEMATRAARHERFDVAILDINLNGDIWCIPWLTNCRRGVSPSFS
jgi:DNA-binding response OmpR family regulator